MNHATFDNLMTELEQIALFDDTGWLFPKAEQIVARLEKLVETPAATYKLKELSASMEQLFNAHLGLADRPQPPAGKDVAFRQDCLVLRQLVAAGR